MRILSGVIILATVQALIKSLVTSEDYQAYAKNLTVITSSLLNKAINGNASVVLHMNGDFSQECRRAMKGFAIAAKRLKKKDLPAEITYIDCKQNKLICEDKLETYTYPTTKYIVRGKIVDIPMKGRTQQLSVQSINDYVKYAGLEIEDRKSLPEIKEKYHRFFFYVGKQDEDYEIYQKMSAAHPFIKWVHTFDKGTVAHVNGIYFYDIKEGTSDMINGPHGPTIGGRMDTFTYKYMNLLRSLPDYVMERLFVHNKASLLLFYPDTDDDRGVQIPWWHSAIKKMYHIPCAQIPMHPTKPKNEHNLTPLRQWLGVENPMSPAVRIVSKDRNGRWRFYQLRDKISAENTNKFFDDWRAGRLKEFHRSERPEKSHGPLKSLVGKNYIKSVSTQKYDVISIIYSDENPTISERALKVLTIVKKVMSNFEYLRFVKINADRNSDEHMPQRGFPYIRLYSKTSGRKFKEYEGLYSAKELSQWLADNIGVENPFDQMIASMKKKKGGRTI